MNMSQVRQAAIDLATLTAGDVDTAMRAEMEAQHAARIAQAEFEIAQAKVTLALAVLDNAREAVDAARTRFGVGWPEVKRILSAGGNLHEECG